MKKPNVEEVAGADRLKRHVATIDELFIRNKLQCSEILAVLAEVVIHTIQLFPQPEHREKIRNWFFDRIQDALSKEPAHG